ncbi:MAG: 50S ribosomal protein L6 [Patescibacteria group bacterium]
MSRIGKKPIQLPEKVDLEIDGKTVKVKGPKGELERTIRPEIKAEEKDGELVLTIDKDTKKSPAFLGLERSLLFNMVKGVTDGFEKVLEMKGVGYRARMEGTTLVVEAGFSHPVKMETPDEVTIEVEKGEIKVKGIKKEKVGQVAAKIRDIRPPEPYKGKGIRYKGEEVVRKEGKKAVGSE